jgi:cellulose synthase/poly-beta-1,6-N-acetylglucosamine synthase-like glycosyltransferase
MDSALEQTIDLQMLFEQIQGPDGLWRLFWLFFPFFILVDLPLALIVTIGVFRWWIRERTLIPLKSLYRPRVSCIIACYSEGMVVHRTLSSLCEQTYKGEIELIPVVDGAIANPQTMQAVREFDVDSCLYPHVRIRPIAKWKRGGRVSALNAGLSMCTGEIVMAMDADTSFDNTMMTSIVRHFEDPNVPAVSGCLRVRNTWASLTTAIQSIEYLLSIQTFKIGLSEWNMVNNVSGAFGAFRRTTLASIGGWDTGTAEDLDLTLRIKAYFGRQRRLRIPFEPRAIGHTDAPTTFKAFLQQRLRWDGDLLFIYARKHRGSFSPELMGWPNFLMTVVSGLFVQVVIPFIIVGYTIICILILPWATFVALSVLVYLFYLVGMTLQFLLMLLLVSERPGKDVRLLPLLPLFPLAMFVIRCWSAVAMLNEWFRRGHEETSMAPWWVLQRGRRF